MIDFKGIAVHYGHQDVLTDVTFRVNKGDRVGVVGPNGSGKSTLFKIILGEMSTDKGEVVIECNPRIGFTRQNPQPDTPDETLLEYSLRGIPGLSEMEAEMSELECALTDPAKMKRYGELQTKFEHLGGYDIETRVKIALGGLGFATEEFDQPFRSFSARSPTCSCSTSPPTTSTSRPWTGCRSSSRPMTVRSCSFRTTASFSGR